MHEEIFALAQTIAHPQADEEALLDALCSAAEAELRSLLREDAAWEQLQQPLRCAAALTAVGQLYACRAGAETEEFTVGDVSVRSKTGDPVSASRAMYLAAERLMAPFRRDDTFAFMGVDG